MNTLIPQNTYKLATAIFPESIISGGKLILENAKKIETLFEKSFFVEGFKKIHETIQSWIKSFSKEQLLKILNLIIFFFKKIYVFLVEGLDLEVDKAAKIVFNSKFPSLMGALLSFLSSDENFRNEVNAKQIGEIVKALGDKAGNTQQLNETMEKMTDALKELKNESGDSNKSKTTQQKVDKISGKKVTIKDLIVQFLKTSVYSVSKQLGEDENQSINSIADSIITIFSNLSSIFSSKTIEK